MRTPVVSDKDIYFILDSNDKSEFLWFFLLLWQYSHAN